MSQTKFLKCSCQNCGGRIEYPADAAGMTIECPHCKWQTELTVEVPEIASSSAAPRNRFLPVVIVLLLVLAALGIAAPMILKRLAAKKRVAVSSPAVVQVTKAATKPVAPVIQNDFEIEKVSIDSTRSGSLTYATGTLRNLLARQRFSVRVELECLDSSGNVLATASDYLASIEPNGVWNFHALVIKGKPTSARVVRITEQQ